ncbi:MAG: helix-turn-helix transcriptional regulator [Bacteroidota bacterium]
MNISKLKNLLQEKKITYEHLASLIGMTRNGLSDAINKETLKISTLEKIANIVGVPVNYFFDDTINNINDQQGIYQITKGNNNRLNINITECQHRLELLQKENEGLKKEIQAKDKIIKLLENQKS